METKKKGGLNVLTIILFTISALIGIALMVFSVWGDLEASFFDITFNGEKNLGTLSCPVLITPQDSGEFSAKISNPIDRTLKTNVRVHVSSNALAMIREENERFDLAPDESKKLAWTVKPEDTAFGQMVLVRVYLFPNHPIPSKDATCGILVVDIPFFTGKQIIYGSFAIGAVGMVAATALWAKNNKPLTKKKSELFRSLSILSGIIIIGSIASILGWWLVGCLSIAVSVLMIFGTFSELIK